MWPSAGYKLGTFFSPPLQTKSINTFCWDKLKLQNQSPGGEKDPPPKKNKQMHTQKKQKNKLWLLVLILPPKIFFYLTKVCE